MIIKSSEFISSLTDIKSCPKTRFPEYSFIGRSNVGKSSLINMLTGRKKLAKTSVHPGKTQTINHFIINNNWYLVDLPGYGFAKISKVKKKAWAGFIKDYILQRKNLVCVFVLIDASIPPQEIDLEFCDNLGKNNIPFVLTFTKTDKASQFEVNKNISQFKDEMLKTWESLPKMILTSAKTKEGRNEILNYIAELNSSFVFDDVFSQST